MKYLWLTYSDGRYHTVVLSEHDAKLSIASREACDIVEVEDRVYASWERHNDDASTWHTLWSSLQTLAISGRSCPR